MPVDWWPLRDKPLADMTLRESVLSTLVSAPVGFVLTVFGGLLKGYARLDHPREVVMLGVAGAVMVPVITVVSFGVARLWRWLWRNFPA